MFKNTILTLMVIGVAATAAENPKNVFLPEAPAAFTTPKGVTLERHVLDEVPASWTSLPGGQIFADEQIRRAGERGIRWDWRSGDRLEIDASKQLETLLIEPHMKVAFGGGIGLHIWIYNPDPLPHKVMTLSMAANGINKEVEFGLNYSGWRACSIQFAEMPDGGDAPEGRIVIRPPEGIGQGTLVFDRYEIGRLGHHTMADYQMAYSKNENHWVKQYWWEQAGKPSVGDIPTNEDRSHYLQMIENIETKSLGWSVHVDDWISDAERRMITSGERSTEAKAVAKRVRKLARERFSALELKSKRPNISVSYSDSASYPNEITWRDLEEKTFPMVSLDYFFYKDEESRKRFLSLLDWFKSQGIVAGHSYGSLSHIGYRSRNLSLGLFLCRDLLAETGRLNEWVDTLKWLSGFSECYTKKERAGGVGDDGTVAMARLICVLLQSNTAEKQRDAECYFEWFDDVLGVSDGTQGVIKADYSFYHHAMMLCGYWLTNVPQFCKVLMALEDTPQAESQAWANVRKNLLVYNRMYRSETQPFNLRGRLFQGTLKTGEPDYRIHDIALAMALHGNPATGEKVDEELASAWLNNRLERMPVPVEFSAFQTDNRYHQVLNWAGVSTHSIPGAFATIAGVNSNLMNWDAGGARVFSRYNRTGSLYLHRGTLSAEENGYVDVGWDWSRIPGVTGAYLDDNALKTATIGSGNYGDDRAFAGGSSLGENGVYGYRICEGTSKEWNGNKSWFFFGDRIVCLGSDLTDSVDAPLGTTLFQLNLASTSNLVSVNGESVSSFPFDGKFENGTVRLIDVQGHGYYIPKGNDAVEVRKQRQTSGNSFGKANSGDFAVAWIDHGKSPKSAEYEYMIRLNAAVTTPSYTVLKKDAEAHVVRDDESGVVAYVVFQVTKNLPGPLKSCSRPGLVMVDGDDVSFCDPDLMTNPGGEITRYNLGNAPASLKREVVLEFSKANTLRFETSNAVVEILSLERSGSQKSAATAK